MLWPINKITKMYRPIEIFAFIEKYRITRSVRKANLCKEGEKERRGTEGEKEGKN